MNPILCRRILSQEARQNPVPNPVVMGTFFLDEFNPQVGTYQNHGVATHSITTGNMLIPSQPFSLNNYVSLQTYTFNIEDMVWSFEYEMTSTGLTDIGPLLMHKSVNSQGATFTLYFGIYSFAAPNMAILQVFGNTINPLYTGTTAAFPLIPSDRASVNWIFTEDSFRVEALVNGVIKDSFNYAYTTVNNPVTGETKLNAGLLAIIPPDGPDVNVKRFEVSSNYYKYADLSIGGDSNLAGYFATNNTNRYPVQIRTTTGKTVNIFSGAGDASADLIACMPLINLFKSKNFIPVIGTNDPVDATWIANYPIIVSSAEANGSTVYPCTLLPRNGFNWTARNNFINTTYGSTHAIIDLYTHFEDPMVVGNINPLYSNDGIHLNAAGETEMATYILSIIII